MPPRPDDYDDYWYQDDDGTWRNEYDDEGYEFADDEYDLEEAEEIAQAIKDEGQARAEAERSQYAAQGKDFDCTKFRTVWKNEYLVIYSLRKIISSND